MNSDNNFKNRRVFCAVGPGDIINAHKFWKQDAHFPGELALTYSGQVEDYCAKTDADLYMVSSNVDAGNLYDGKFRIQNSPKPFNNPKGVFFHLGEIYYAAKLAIKAIWYGADVFISDFDTPHRYILIILKLFSIKVIPVLHSTLWPKGYLPQKGLQRLLLWLSSFYYRYGVHGVICLSPECARQVDKLTKGRSAPLYQFRPQYLPDHFRKISPAPPHERRPFHILFVGRVVENKGVFDILDMARAIEGKAPGSVYWDICGSGSDLDELKLQCHQKGLDSIVKIHGWTDPEEQIDRYEMAHASIVPTKSSFEEGFAKTAIEAILFGRPVITNPVVPAVEVLEAAAVVAETDNINSYVEEILRLINDRDLYQEKVKACTTFSAPYYDRSQGLTSALDQALSD